jgi:hypothetical protein
MGRKKSGKGDKRAAVRPGLIKEVLLTAGLVSILGCGFLILGYMGIKKGWLPFFVGMPESRMEAADNRALKDGQKGAYGLSEDGQSYKSGYQAEEPMIKISGEESQIKAEEPYPGEFGESGSLEAWGEEEAREYEAYIQRLLAVRKESQIEEMGFVQIREHTFPMETEKYGQVFLIPALDQTYHRLALFFASPQGDICYTTDRLAANYQNRGILKQTNEGIAAVSFQDMNEDGLTDIILITFCKEPGKDAGKLDKVGDVLFQGAEGFYRDWRLSDKLNRFHMNKSAGFVRSFVKDNYSTEFLYTTVTLKGLLSHGFEPIKEQCSWQDFEKLGKLKVVPGIYKMAEYYIFMVYLVNEQGYIVQSFQPMGDYENLYSLQEISCCDIDGDGMKDLVILGNYSYEGSGGEMLIEKDYSVFYQQTGGFREDIEIKDEIFCHEDTNMEELLKQAWSYWGWGLFEEKEANEK